MGSAQGVVRPGDGGRWHYRHDLMITRTGAVATFVAALVTVAVALTAVLTVALAATTGTLATPRTQLHATRAVFRIGCPRTRTALSLHGDATEKTTNPLVALVACDALSLAIALGATKATKRINRVMVDTMFFILTFRDVCLQASDNCPDGVQVVWHVSYCLFLHVSIVASAPGVPAREAVAAN
jgi:hypothetical protein